MLKQLQQQLKQLKNQNQAKILQSFFKTQAGQYGAGDLFWGIKVPQLRKITKNYLSLNLTDLKKLLNSPVHECRLAALIILTEQYRLAGASQQYKIYRFYLKNSRHVNNWDLVDLSAPKIVGRYLLNKDKSALYKLAASPNLWQRRIAIVSTLEFIKHQRFRHALKISKILLTDRQDLIHKAVGWMLREVGKRNQPLLEKFLKQHLQQLPRTTLRYAIEKFPEQKRKYYLNQ